MRDYNYRKNWNDLLTPEIVKKLTLIHEYKGEQELKRIEEFRKAQAEIEKKNEKPMSQKMFKAI